MKWYPRMRKPEFIPAQSPVDVGLDWIDHVDEDRVVNLRAAASNHHIVIAVYPEDERPV
jgi:hypothetical protein